MTTPRSTHDDTPKRALACSLLDEALALARGEVQATMQEAQPVPMPRRPMAHWKPGGWDTASVAEALDAFVMREGRPPWSSDWEQPYQHGLPAKQTVARLYGSLQVAYTAHGLVWVDRRRRGATQTAPALVRQGTRPSRYTWDASRVNEALQAFVASMGRPPCRNEWQQATAYRLPSRTVVLRVYGTLAAAYAANGLEYPTPRRRVPPPRPRRRHA